MTFAVGALTFGYNTFRHFEKQLADQGRYSVNLGDYMQTLAVEQAWSRLGFEADRLRRVDRDDMAAYDGPQVLLPMNACFYPRSFPLSDKIIPVFIGFQAKAGVVNTQRALLAAHSPVGCRDHATLEACRAAGIEAYLSGCLTFSIAQRSKPVERTRPYIIFGDGAGALPLRLLKCIPDDVLDAAVLIRQRREMRAFPVKQRDQNDLRLIAKSILDEIRDRASIVITSLHHAASPALASGVPVVLARRDDDDRFGFMKRLIPLHVPENFPDIDWAPAAPDLRDLKKGQDAQFRRAVDLAIERAGLPK